MNKIVAGKFCLGKRIRSGGFWTVYSGIAQISNSNQYWWWKRNRAQVGTSFNRIIGTSWSQSSSIIAWRKNFKILKRVRYWFIKRIVGIPELYWLGIEGDFNIIAIELLGPSLERLFDHCGRKFSLKTTLMIADQMVNFTLNKDYTNRIYSFKICPS